MIGVMVVMSRAQD